MKIKMLLATLALLFTIGTSNIVAQTPQKSDKLGTKAEQKSKIEAMKRAFIIEEAKLTPDEASKFFPLYKEFTKKRKALKPSDGADGADTDRKRAELKDEYYKKYLEFMPEPKVKAVMKALRDFRRKIAQEMQNK